MTPNDHDTQILIVDDHEMVRMALATVFAEYKDLTLMGEASNGQEAVDFCFDHQPDVILMDMNMPIMDGVAATRIICQAYPLIKVLMLTNSGAFEQIQMAIDAGATGYMRKNISSAELVVIIRASVFSSS